jgi:hypothetical protein
VAPITGFYILGVRRVFPAEQPIAELQALWLVPMPSVSSERFHGVTADTPDGQVFTRLTA